MTIKEIALQKKAEYENGYTEWCVSNPGKIMNGLSSMAIGAELASYCDTKEDLDTLIKVYSRKATNATGPHGHKFLVDAFKEILKIYSNDNK